MKTLILASTRSDAGKTNLIVGLGKALGGKVGYLKPLGDRLRYHRKVLWDLDADLMTRTFGLNTAPEDITLGFDHDKLRFMYDPESAAAKLRSMAASASEGRELLFVEGGRDLTYGASLRLDAMSLARTLAAPVILVLSGGREAIMDDCAFLCRFLDREEFSLKGVILNKLDESGSDAGALVNDVGRKGIPVLGAIPRTRELTTLKVAHLSELLFAKLLAGEENLDREIRHVYVASMAPDAAARDPHFKRDGTLVITSGDRSHMILTALESGASAIVLTNNHVPPSSILSKASELGTPVLLVSPRTYQTARQVEEMEPLLTSRDTLKIGLMEKLVREHIDTKSFATG